jgi:glycosyltransferase involved in cell wall biosynthesis
VLSAPVLVGDLHLDAPLPDLSGDSRYRGARLLAWLHGRPIGEIQLSLDERPLSAGGLAAVVWPAIADQVAGHCAEDGIPPPRRLPPGGFTRPARLPCETAAEPAETPSITVVIATRDRPRSLLRCLESVTRADYPAFDVVVVDSAPRSEASAVALARRAWPFPLRYLRVPRPGLALAHNAALTAVTGEIVAITDDDVEVGRGWLAALATAFAQSGAACVTGLILPGELETRAQLLAEQAWGFGRGFAPHLYSRDTPGTDPLFPFAAGRFGSGANMAFRTDWLVSRGGFDPATGAGTPARGGDDLIAFLKVITDGGTLRYAPTAIVRHWRRRDCAGLRRQAFGYGVGFGAYLTASLCARPGLSGAMLGRSGRAMRYLLDPGSVKNVGREPGFPRELIWRERAGMLAGPFAYLVSRWRYRDCRSGPVPGGEVEFAPLRDLAPLAGNRPGAARGPGGTVF